MVIREPRKCILRSHAWMLWERGQLGTHMLDRLSRSATLRPGIYMTLSLPSSDPPIDSCDACARKEGDGVHRVASHPQPHKPSSFPQVSRSVGAMGRTQRPEGGMPLFQWWHSLRLEVFTQLLSYRIAVLTPVEFLAYFCSKLQSRQLLLSILYSVQCHTIAILNYLKNTSTNHIDKTFTKKNINWIYLFYRSSE